jgi:hypothetical protein
VANLDNVLGLLRRSDHSFHRTARRQRWVMIAGALTIGALYVGGIVAVINNLIRVWQGGIG